ncbi:MAG: hypothetical protein WC479_11985 [Candidatus Izemoplasmatales bacterium]
MSNVTVTISPAGANTLGAKWCLAGVTEWLDSAETVSVSNGSYTIQYKYIEGYSTPAEEDVTVTGTTTKTGTYGALSWKASWQPPISMCFFRGQVITCGVKHTSPDNTFSTLLGNTNDARLVRWSEIGAFRFMGCTANDLRNEAGEYYIGESDSEMALRVIPLHGSVICYGSFSITEFTPVKDPAPGFTIRKLAEYGIKNPLAVDGNDTTQVFIDRLGYLNVLTVTKTGTKVKRIGYQDIFSPMQEVFSFVSSEGIISVVYNDEEDEYYISNGLKSYLWSSGDLTEMSIAFTSIVNMGGAILSSHDASALTEKPISASTLLSPSLSLLFGTDTFDLEMVAIKTIVSVEVVGSWSQDAVTEVMIQWKNNKGQPFRNTTWKRCSPMGFCAPMVSGVDFRIFARVTPYIDAVIESINLEWQLTDKNSIRGNYTNVNTASTNAG